MAGARRVNGRFAKKVSIQTFVDENMGWQETYEEGLEPYEGPMPTPTMIGKPNEHVDNIINDDTMTKAEKIRRMFRAGMTVRQIKGLLNIRQAHVYTTLVHSGMIHPPTAQAA